MVLPLIRSEIPWVPLPSNATFSQTIGFFGNGNQWQSSRPKMLAKVREATLQANVSFKEGAGEGCSTWAGLGYACRFCASHLDDCSC